MTLLLISALLATAAAVYVIVPIGQRRAAALADVAPGALLDAEAKRRVAIASLKELEYDFLGGKLDEADYADQRETLSREALQAIRAADVARDGGEGPVPAAAAAAGAGPEAHACGFRNPAGSRFCGGCGASLPAA